jgi:hypothetical protein
LFAILRSSSLAGWPDWANFCTKIECFSLGSFWKL